MNQDNESSQRARRVEVSLRIRLLRSIIRKKEQEIEDQANREVDESDFIDDAEIERLESHFKQLEFFLDSMEKPAGFFSVSSFDELCNELLVHPDMSNTPIARERTRDENDEASQCEQQPPVKVFKHKEKN